MPGPAGHELRELVEFKKRPVGEISQMIKDLQMMDRTADERREIWRNVWQQWVDLEALCRRENIVQL